MNPITQELLDIAAELTAAGVPASCDPASALSMLAAHPAAALITYDTDLRLTIGSAGIHLEVEVWLITAAPLDLAAVERLHDLLIPAAKVARPEGSVTRDRWESSEGRLPAYRWITLRALPYPTL